MKAAFAIMLFFGVNILSAQPGCPDPQALNFDAGATENDGSCIYPMTNYSLMEISELPDDLKECSGSEWFNSKLWVHNDGGNANEVYRIDSLSGEILQTVSIANVGNMDWEDLAQSETHLFIGDFGNNMGNRTDLKIYRVNKDDFLNDAVSAEVISFEYSDQVDFSENTNNNDFDCEAFLFFNNQLHLFSKNWVDNETKHYRLSAEPGNHVAQLQESFDVGGLITSADVSANDEIVLLGYTEFGFNFMWLLFDFSGDEFFSGNKRQISLGTGLTNSQTEAITFRENGYGYICAEEFKVNDILTLPQKMLSFSINQWTDEITSTKDVTLLNSITVFPNPVQDFFEIENTAQQKLSWKLYNETGWLVKGGNTDSLKTKVDAADLSAGIYYLLISQDDFQSHFTMTLFKSGG